MNILEQRLTSDKIDAYAIAVLGGLCLALATVLPEAWNFAALTAGAINFFWAYRLHMNASKAKSFDSRLAMGLMVDHNAALVDAIKSLRQEVARLSERVATLEQHPAAEKLPPPATRTVQTKPISSESISEEIVMVISAAIAAYLGVKPHLRQIRLLNNNPWGLQGRVTIQASHALETYHG